jgi:hypothetical protein
MKYIKPHGKTIDAYQGVSPEPCHNQLSQIFVHGKGPNLVQKGPKNKKVITARDAFAAFYVGVTRRCYAMAAEIQPQGGHSMHDSELLHVAESLEIKIIAADPPDQLVFQPEFNRVLNRIRAAGLPVPHRLRRLDALLMDELLERSFDNVPV